MADTTKIAWCRNSDGTPGATFNPWIGCTRVSAGCAGCYAEKFVRRMAADMRVQWGKGKARRRTTNDNWKKPLRWNREAAAKGIRIRVFTASLADIFDAEVPPEWRADLWQLIRETPNLDWIIVTHRAENIRDMLPEDWGDGWPNVWLVVTAEDQKAADHRIPLLLSIPATVRGLSLEPLLGPVNICWALSRNPLDIAAGFLRRGHFAPGLETLRALDWILIGGESGAANGTGARLCQLEWIAALVKQCRDAGVASFVKQLGSNPWRGDEEYPAAEPAGRAPEEWPDYLRVHQMPRSAHG